MTFTGKCILVFFHERSRFTGQQTKGAGISLTPHYHFHPLHRRLNISRAITGEYLPHIATSRTQTESLIYTYIISLCVWILKCSFDSFILLLLLLLLFTVVIELSSLFSSIRLKQWKKDRILLFKWWKMNNNRNVWNIYILWHT